MENEVLQQILSELKELKQGQADMKAEMDRRFDQVDERFDKVDAQLKALWQDVDYALDKIDEHEKKFHSAS